MSGSTLVVAIVSPRYVITSNCGDSRCILISEDGGIVSETSDHKPERPDEKQRIEVQYRARVRRQCDLGSYGKVNSSDQDSEAPYRVWSSVIDMPGLAMSRSIGDGMAKGLGVIADPEVKVFYSTPEAKLMAIALASDGIWDVLESKDLSELLIKTKNEFQNDKAFMTKDYVNKIMQQAH